MFDEDVTTPGLVLRSHFPRRVHNGHDIVSLLRDVADALDDNSTDPEDVLDISFQRLQQQDGEPRWSAVLMTSADENAARNRRVPDHELPEVDASEVVAGLRALALPDGWIAGGALLLLKCSVAGGAAGWAFRTTEGVTDEEALGVLELRAAQVRNLLLDSYGG